MKKNSLRRSSPVSNSLTSRLISWRLRRFRTLTSPISVMSTVHEKHAPSARWGCSDGYIRPDPRSRSDQERGVAELGIFLPANLAAEVEVYYRSVRIKSIEFNPQAALSRLPRYTFDPNYAAR